MVGELQKFNEALMSLTHQAISEIYSDLLTDLFGSFKYHLPTPESDRDICIVIPGDCLLQGNSFLIQVMEILKSYGNPQLDNFDMITASTPYASRSMVYPWT